MGEKSRNAFAWSVFIIPISLPFGEDNEMLSVPITTLSVAVAVYGRAESQNL